jgi:hypothetical protein
MVWSILGFEICPSTSHWYSTKLSLTEQQKPSLFPQILPLVADSALSLSHFPSPPRSKSWLGANYGDNELADCSSNQKVEYDTLPRKGFCCLFPFLHIPAVQNLSPGIINNAAYHLHDMLFSRSPSVYMPMTPSI